jgi:protein SCO1/2
MTVWRLLMAGLAMIGTACSSGPEIRSYELHGQILVVKPETNEVLVKHEDIKGFMPAMTMPYIVRDPAQLKERVAGDLITATLNVAPNEAFLSNISKTGSAPLPEDARSDIPAAANVHLLKPGDTVPGTTLTDQDGKPFTLRDFRGTAVAVTFIYTRCPLPQFCPFIDRRFAEVQKLVAVDPALAERVRLLSISFDPSFDTGAALRAHGKKVGADPKLWMFANAEAATVDRLAAEFGINVIREKDGTITHNLRTAIVDPSGRISLMLDNNAWTAGELVSGLKNAIAAKN